MANITQYQNVPTSTIPRDLTKLEDKTGNIYESISIISKRANQISAQLKEELTSKLNEFASDSDTLEEVFENREQIEISAFYERLPKPVMIATEEFMADKVYFRNPARENQK
ncbi:MAG TPA: DNA-directed RNA polymerase subunit omega [Bacteroidia bacterium]|jgi:DNA-directed RNA polymerase subunit K/omega|nr:DNA-directed RNA polymerase subunit omega [Bacteroidia bacterium]MBP7259860.1 DNA-directed RNA polymerase subunit omega [Bacteroidia bacterium]MBP9179200.1 DNA-directed RNA polymerase subunit omega [Bacteroidia bacterium]MBP9723501.1 DNA-directed RNA polymerase subunit omega [Bacteroidia bacterium]HLP34023.1 DNA-directed RNA polymerase subunit omega [Bacteroidia bacterium]